MREFSYYIGAAGNWGPIASSLVEPDDFETSAPFASVDGGCGPITEALLPLPFLLDSAFLVVDDDLVSGADSETDGSLVSGDLKILGKLLLRHIV